MATIRINFLSEGEIQDIHDASIEILGNTGVMVHHDDILQLLGEAGAKIAKDKGIPISEVKYALGIVKLMKDVFKADVAK